MPQTKWLKQQNCTFSQFWRLEAQAQGVSRVGFFQGLFHWLPDDCLLAGSSCGHPCVHNWSLFLFLWGHQSDPIRAYPRGLNWASLVAQLVKKSACNVGDLGSIPGPGRSPGEGKGYPLQYSGVKNSMDCIVHGVTKSQTQVSNFHFTKGHN